VLRREGWKVVPGAGVDAAVEHYAVAKPEGAGGVLEVDRCPGVDSPVTLR
jgi:hypothetical protein